MLHRIKPTGIFIFLFSTFGTLILYFLAKPNGFNWSANYPLVISQIISLVGTVYLALSFVLSSRFPFLEKTIGGLDIVYKVHHFFGATSFILLLHHPLLLAVQKLPNAQLALQYFIPAKNLAYNFGIGALTLMIMLIIFTLFVQLPYHIWKNIHIWMGGVLLLSMLHIFFISSDVSRYLPLQIWMFFWMGLGFVSYLYKRFFYNIYHDSYQYKVIKTKNFENYVELVFEPVSDKKMSFRSGQFLFFSAKNEVIGKESHPFSIASSPDEKNITIYCKKLGDYTKRLELLKINDEVTLHGPYGTFFETVPIRNNIVGIAGGIGLTPFLSLLKNTTEIENKNITVFHVVKNKNESLLSESEQNQPNTKTIIHESSVQGRFTLKNLQNIVENFRDVTFYLCGPMAMMESMRSQLLKVGVKPSKIIFEDFAFGT